MDDGRGELLGKARGRHVSKRAQSKSLLNFVSTSQILLDRLDAVNKDIGVRLVVEHDSNRYVTRHLFLKALTIDQTHGDIVSKINVIAENVRVDKLPDVLASVIGL